MKRIDSIVGDLKNYGFNENVYKNLKTNNLNKRYVNNLWLNTLKMLPLSPELLLKLKKGEEFKTTINYNDSSYKINYQETDNDKHKLLCVIISNIQQKIGFNIKLNNMHVVEMDIGQPTPIKQGCYYSYKKRKLVFSYYNEQGINIYTTEFNFDYHKYDIKLDNSKIIYSFCKDKLISFCNHDKDITIDFYKFTNPNKYRISEVRKNNVTVGFFYKGNIKNINRVVNDKKTLIVYYSKGTIKCKYSYEATSGILDGLYTQYDSKGQITQKINYKQGSLHGLCKKYKDGILVEKITYKEGVKDGPYLKVVKGNEIHRIYKNGKLIKRR